MKTIEIPNDLHAKLTQLGGGLFTPTEVLERLLRLSADTGPSISESTSESVGAEPDIGRLHRFARERGISITIDGTRIDAVSVRDLFGKVLQWLVDGGKMKSMEAALPLRTSNQRYLLAREPVHPGGNDFVVPVTYKGYSMEAHKNYENAMSGLKQLAKRAGFSIAVVK